MIVFHYSTIYLLTHRKGLYLHVDGIFVVGDIGATHADPMEAIQSFVCVVIGIHGRELVPTIHVQKGETN